VSTFGGESQNLGQDNPNDGWQYIKNNVGFPFYFIPEWSGFEANTVYQDNPVMDGFLSWVAWPGPTENAATLQSIDNIYQSNKGSKTYVAPVSPYFFAHLPGKNYLYKTETLWIDRWSTLLNTQPDFIEILTWNDWGESHYIGKIDPNSNDLPTDSPAYVYGFTHEAWQAILPAFIAAYKNGQTSPVINHDIVIYWHRANFVDGVNCNDGIGTPAVENRDITPSGYAIDQVIGNNIFVAALLTAPVEITITNADYTSETSSLSFNAGLTISSSFIMTESGVFTFSVTDASSGSIIGQATDAVGVAASGGTCNYNAYVNRIV